MRDTDPVAEREPEGMGFGVALAALVLFFLAALFGLALLAWTIAHPVSLIGLLALLLYGASR